MSQQKKYLLGFRVLCLIIFFRLLILTIVYFTVHRFATPQNDLSQINIFSAYEIIVMAIFFLQAIIYWSLRYNIVYKSWVKAHVWLIFFAMVILPFFMWLGLIVAPRYLGMEQIAVFRLWSANIRFYLGWSLIIIAHVYFILTLVTFFNTKKINASTVKSADVLEEFSS